MYMIAYKDQNGNDWKGLPWLVMYEKNLELVKQRAKDMINEGYKDVTVFKDWGYTGIVTWNDVYNNKVNLD